MKDTVRLGGKDHPIVQNWLTGQQSVGQRWFNWQRSPTLSELDMADFWIAVTAHDPVQEETERVKKENKRREAENKRPTKFQLKPIHQKLWEALESREFPGRLFVRFDQAQVLDSQEELRLQEEYRAQRGIPKKTFQQLLQTNGEVQRQTALPEHQRKGFVALRPEELEQLKEEIGTRIRTAQNLHKRLKALGMVEPDRMRPKKRVARPSRRTPSR